MKTSKLMFDGNVYFKYWSPDENVEVFKGTFYNNENAPRFIELTDGGHYAAYNSKRKNREPVAVGTLNIVVRRCERTGDMTRYATSI